MNPKTTARLKKFLIIPAILLGIAGFAYRMIGKEPPRQKENLEETRLVRVISVPALTVVPRALGYGNVRPVMVWKAIAEVSGKIVEVHPRLRKGAILPAGTVLLRIDPADYQLAVAQSKANIRSARAELEELRVKELNTRASLKIEARALSLNEQELTRKRELLKKGSITTQSAVDQEERNVLKQEQTVQNMKNTLNLIPAEREVLNAKVAQLQAQLEEAERNLKRTTITAPFDCRIAEFDAERTQYAAQGQVLVVADSIDVSEVSAQIPIDKLRRLVEVARGRTVTLSDVGKMGELLGLTAVVRLRGGDFVAEWKGRFDRLSDTIDPQTRTIGAIVTVEDAFQKVEPGVRPLLTKNMFVEVEVRGKPLPGRLVIPRSALHEGRVYVVDAESRLEIRKVEIAFFQTNFALLKNGLREGEQVVVSDLIPAIVGMKLKSVPDESLARSLEAEAGGEVPVK